MDFTKPRVHTISFSQTIAHQSYSQGAIVGFMPCDKLKDSNLYLFATSNQKYILAFFDHKTKKLDFGNDANDSFSSKNVSLLGAVIFHQSSPACNQIAPHMHPKILGGELGFRVSA